MSLRGILAGSLTLIFIHTLVAYKGPSQRLNELAGPRGIAVRIVEGFLSPTVPGIPKRGASSSTSTSPDTSTATTAQTQAGREEQADRLGGGRYPAPVYSGPPPGGVPGRQNP